MENQGLALGGLNGNFAHTVSQMIRRYGQVSAPADSRDVEQVVCNSYMNSDDFYGYIFMCNGRTKPECYMYRVFGLPAGRREVIEKIKPGMKLFLFDYDSKCLYGVYEATTAGKLNWEPTAFGGKFPAQVRFHIYKECLPLLESSFQHAIRDNYQTGSRKFNPILSRQQVSHLLSMFNPLTKPSSATYNQYPVKDQSQSHLRLPPPSHVYFNLINSGHAPQTSLPPSYSSMCGRITSPALEPQYAQMSVLQPEHVGYGYAAQMGYNNPAMQLQANSAPYQTSYSVGTGHPEGQPQANSAPYQTSYSVEAGYPAVQPQTNSAPYQTSYCVEAGHSAVQPQANSAPYQTSYFVEAGHSYLPEVPKSYESYEAAAQAMVPSHQYTDLRYEHNQLPSQTQMPMQGNVAQHQSMYQVPAAHHVAQPIQQHALRF